MPARLVYGKVIDREVYMAHGGKITPGLENKVLLHEEPGPAAAFLVLRAWTAHHGTFTEGWRIEGSGGGIAYESIPREIHLATESHVEHLEDEVADLDFQYAAEDYNLVFKLDDREVARIAFPVRSDRPADEG
jgi:hypothetical protein